MARYNTFFVQLGLTGYSATDSGVMLRSLQYFHCRQTESCFWPLLALQPQQQKAIFSLGNDFFASLISCFQLAQVFLETFAGVNTTPQ